MKLTEIKLPSRLVVHMNLLQTAEGDLIETILLFSILAKCIHSIQYNILLNTVQTTSL